MARSTLAEALDSIACQTYPHIEAVVVNALGSAHPPPSDICGSFQLRFIDHGRPLERSAAANAGLEAASGRYLGFLDDDDLLFPEHVSILADALQGQAKTRVAYSGVRMIAYQTDGAPCFETLYNQPFHLPSLRAQNYIPIHAVLFDRTLWEAGCRFDESLALYEDWDFWLQLAEHTAFLHIEQITACYRNFGHSGFGFGELANATKIAAGRAALFEKWRKRWSGAELSEALAALRDEIIHRSPRQRADFSSGETLADSITRLEQTIAKLGSERRNQDEALYICQQQVEALSETVQNLRDRLAERSQQLEQVYQSTSWQITEPLRALMHAWRAWRASRQ